MTSALDTIREQRKAVKAGVPVVEAPAPVTPTTAPSGALFATITDAAGHTSGVFSVPGKLFKTGSRGYWASGKLDYDGKRYQAQIQIVEIHSKTE